MFVRKFEADTIEEALRDIKRELGPDAVILKTITNTGLKGAFKKKKIEVTAAISERNFVRKAKVDHVLNDNQKDEFYNSSASYIANMIDQHDQSQERSGVQNNKQSNSNKGAGYGLAGLNKQVNMTKGLASQLKEGLDDFLSLGEKEDRYARSKEEEFDFDDEINNSRAIDYTQEKRRSQAFKQEAAAPRYQEAPPVRSQPAPQPQMQAAPQSQTVQTQSTHNYAQQVAPTYKTSNVTDEAFEKQKNKVEELEKKLFELSRSFERVNRKEPIGIYQLRTILKSLDINEVFVQGVVKKGMFELTDTDVENSDIVFEYALKEMMNNVVTAQPLFIQNPQNKTPVVTVFLSELSSGQSSMIQKVAANAKDSIIIRNTVLKTSAKADPKIDFAEKMFGLRVINTNSVAEMASECRKAVESGKNVLIDLKCKEIEGVETKKFLDGLKRAFSRVEVLITLSAIHTELYNRKIISSYKKVADGIVVSHLDACLNFGSLFNITNENKELPFKYFGTGEITPDDIELATAERLMAGIFKLS